VDGPEVPGKLIAVFKIGAVEGVFEKHKIKGCANPGDAKNKVCPAND
jgi:hypothetical protein